ncbi:sulfotransferase family protein [Rhodovulum sulfidophilum]|uniref:sulfotransferase domain-containing protein n=1 Tax=Rhodovulum sulfidophilum TaxID=35806 RepID=UPI001F1FE527|nr:sulfotransferase domain-containing protein [Rhodovulum sulfidophilum]MCE8439899.1 sulfotransferase domain-containing protein [Rhodovulum sulfidophilum]
MSIRKPNFLIIGAQKAGSTWIYDVLRKHEKVFLPRRIELLFFNKVGYQSPSRMEAYLENFRDATERHQWVGERTPGYFWSSRAKHYKDQPPSGHNLEIPQSVARVLGRDLRLILSLRHPVSRAISAYGHHGARGRIKGHECLCDTVGRLGRRVRSGRPDRYRRRRASAGAPADVDHLLELYRPTITALKDRFGPRLDAWDRKTAAFEEFDRKHIHLAAAPDPAKVSAPSTLDNLYKRMGSAGLDRRVA